MSDEIPEKALLVLDEDVAAWLHSQADALFGGDVGKAMNHYLRTTKDHYEYWRAQGFDPGDPPKDPWSRLDAFRGFQTGRVPKPRQRDAEGP